MNEATNRDKSADNAVPAGDRARKYLNALGSSEQMSRVRPASLFNLQVALAALAEDGVAGSLTIHIPAKPGAPIEMEYASKSYA